MGKEKKSTNRRDFLKMTTVGAPAAAAVTLVGQKATASEHKPTGGLKKGDYYYKYLELAKF